MATCVSSFRRCLAILISLLTLTASAHADTPRQVIWVHGSVTAKQFSERKAHSIELQPTDSLHGKLRIVVAPKDALWLLDDQRQLIGLHGPGTWDVIEGASVRGEGRVTRIPVQALGLEQPPIVPWVEVDPRHEPKSLVLPLSPTETAVTTRRPVLRWRNQPGVLRVALTLLERDESGDTRLVETWEGLTGSHHEVRRPLRPGHDYAWRLRPDGDIGESEVGSPQPTTWFHVLSDEAIQSARRADATISSLQLDYPDATRALNVLRALTWERHGLAKEAQRAWDEITAEAGDVEALRLYRARLSLRALSRPRITAKKTPALSTP
jgi:hypothetical protein